MGGIRGLKRKKKAEQDNNNEEVAPLLTSIPDQTHFSDWWHHFSKRFTETDMAVVKSKFETIRGLPNCCGAIDTTHIKMNLSVGDKSNVVWHDKEKNHSMILQAIVDSDMRFLDIVCGWPGSVSDSVVFESSNFFKLCNEGKRLNGKTLKLSERAKLKEYIVGDIGFPLLPWLLTPYQGRNISEYKVSFNRRHIATQMVAQKALSKLKETWKIIDGVVWRPDKDRLPRIIFVCCLLHNITILIWTMKCKKKFLLLVIMILNTGSKFATLLTRPLPL